MHRIQSEQTQWSSHLHQGKLADVTVIFVWHDEHSRFLLTRKNPEQRRMNGTKRAKGTKNWLIRWTRSTCHRSNPSTQDKSAINHRSSWVFDLWFTHFGHGAMQGTLGPRVISTPGVLPIQIIQAIPHTWVVVQNRPQHGINDSDSNSNMNITNSRWNHKKTTSRIKIQISTTWTAMQATREKKTSFPFPACQTLSSLLLKEKAGHPSQPLPIVLVSHFKRGSFLPWQGQG